jgi:hypothetical protein
MHALGARWLLGSARPRESTDPELRAAIPGIDASARRTG